MKETTTQERWFDQAACKGQCPFLWFPPDDLDREWQESLELLAKRVCERCPVRNECLEHEIRETLLGVPGTGQGIWGGLNPKERKQLIDDARRAEGI